MKDKSITNRLRALITAINMCLFSFVWIYYYNPIAFSRNETAGAIVSIVLWIFIYLKLCDLYGGFSIASSNISESALSQFLSFAIADLILYIIAIISCKRYVSISRGAAIVLMQFFISYMVVKFGKNHLMKVIKPLKTVIIYGKNIKKEDADRFAEKLLHKYSHLFDIKNIVSDENGIDENLRIIGESDRAIFYNVEDERKWIYDEKCFRENKIFYFVPDFVDIISRSCTIKHLLDTPLIRYDYKAMRAGQSPLKRFMDVFVSLTLLIILFPVMLIVSICIKLEDGGDIIYKQARMTKGHKEFNVYKFRSMCMDAEKNGAKPATDNDDRITKIGKFIRKTRIDETPQLINILKGEMSFVGPRPERIEHVEIYEKELPEFKYRLNVKAGLTGYAQVFGKYNTTPEDKLRLDFLYMENQSFILDFVIILLTLKTIFQGEESAEGFEEVKSLEMNKEMMG